MFWPWLDRIKASFSVCIKLPFRHHHPPHHPPPPTSTHFLSPSIFPLSPFVGTMLCVVYGCLNSNPTVDQTGPPRQKPTFQNCNVLHCLHSNPIEVQTKWQCCCVCVWLPHRSRKTSSGGFSVVSFAHGCLHVNNSDAVF